MTTDQNRSAASAVAEQTIRELSDELVALRERCKELEEQVETAAKIANDNRGAGVTMVQMREVIHNLAGTASHARSPERAHLAAALAAIAFICDNTRATFARCDVGEIPF